MEIKNKLNYLETLMVKWQNQFDEKPSMETLSFQINKHGMIMIAGHEICQMDFLSTEEYDVGPDYFNLILTDGDYITVEILWTYSDAPVVSAICLHHFMYHINE